MTQAQVQFQASLYTFTVKLNFNPFKRQKAEIITAPEVIVVPKIEVQEVPVAILELSPEPEDTRTLEERVAAIRWWHCIDLGNGLITPGECPHGHPKECTERFGIPADLSGKTVLDIGAWDGLFSFEALKRGAKKVVAIDVPLEDGGNWGGTDGFKLAQEILGTDVDYQLGNIETLGFEDETFDVVFCFGILYHVKDIIRSCENLARVTGEVALIENVFSKVKGGCLMEYRPGYVGDPTNYWYPNIECLTTMLLKSGFQKVEHIWTESGVRLTMRAWK